jgi:polyphosphate kinase
MTRKAEAPVANPILLNRDLSMLSFNRRVLALAAREDYPLLERLRYLSISATILDEFFEVRMANQLEAFKQTISTVGSFDNYHKTSQTARSLVDQQYVLFNEQLMPALAEEGIVLLPNSARNSDQKQWVDKYFQHEVMPVLMPIALDPAHPFPMVANKALHFIAQLKPKNGSTSRIAILRVPRTLPRLIKLPRQISAGKQAFVLLTSVIRANLNTLFQDGELENFSQFRVTRNSDVLLDEEEVSDLLAAMRQELATRHYGEAVRLEVSHGCSEFLSNFLLEQFDLPPAALYRVNGPVNLGRLIQLPDMTKADKLKFSSFKPNWPSTISNRRSILSQIDASDLLLHHPYESFSAVIKFMEEAVHDPAVIAIRMTIYRTGSDTTLISLLQKAVRLGKEVLVVVELKARFDEEQNINWAEALESVGAQVVYGLVGLKTHAKMLLVTRREGRQIKRYGHLSTGNYNPKTAGFYTDLCMLTADKIITTEMETLFRHLTSQEPLPKLSQLVVAPYQLQSFWLTKITELERAAKAGKAARLTAKMNALTDDVLVQALIKAASAGVKIDLIVRGACVLPLGLPEIAGNVRVRSVLGRFLEHSRAFYFEIGKRGNMWLSSADWMNRNMLRRFEVAWPVRNEGLCKRIYAECLQLPFDDNADAWDMLPDGNYKLVGKGQQKRMNSEDPISAQQSLIEKYNR